MTKVCTKCGIEKDYSEYYICKSNKSGKAGPCKVCWSIRSKENRNKNIDIIRSKEREYSRLHPHSKEYYKEYNKKNKDKLDAYRKRYKVKNKEKYIEWRKNNLIRINGVRYVKSYSPIVELMIEARKIKQRLKTAKAE